MAASAPADGTRRLAYLDGLRGIAIGLVLLFHAWWHRIPSGVPAYKVPLPTPLHLFASRGYEGVSLFFVISGFVLALPTIKRRLDGDPNWFQSSQFFSKRILRILPPYYVALALLVVASYILPAIHDSLSDIGEPANLPNILSHLLLIHNLTPYSGAINGSFWSLGLEWQWYLLFPFVLIASLRAPVSTLAACLALTITWHYATGDLWGIGAPPARLVEFALGIAAAHLIARNRQLPLPTLWLAFLLPIAAVECPIRHLHIIPHTLTVTGLRQPLYGMAFTALLLLGAQSIHMQRILSWSPLVRLGLISYSVYLIHEPVIDWAEQTWPSHWIVPISIALGIAAGALFYWLVERPCSRKGVKHRVEPRLAGYLYRLDTLWPYREDPPSEPRSSPHPIHVGITE